VALSAAADSGFSDFGGQSGFFSRAFFNSIFESLFFALVSSIDVIFFSVFFSSHSEYSLLPLDLSALSCGFSQPTAAPSIDSPATYRASSSVFKRSLLSG